MKKENDLTPGEKWERVKEVAEAAAVQKAVSSLRGVQTKKAPRAGCFFCALCGRITTLRGR